MEYSDIVRNSYQIHDDFRRLKDLEDRTEKKVVNNKYGFYRHFKINLSDLRMARRQHALEQEFIKKKGLEMKANIQKRAKTASTTIDHGKQKKKESVYERVRIRKPGYGKFDLDTGLTKEQKIIQRMKGQNQSDKDEAKALLSKNPYTQDHLDKVRAGFKLNIAMDDEDGDASENSKESIEFSDEDVLLDKETEQAKALRNEFRRQLNQTLKQAEADRDKQIFLDYIMNKSRENDIEVRVSNPLVEIIFDHSKDPAEHITNRQFTDLLEDDESLEEIMTKLRQIYLNKMVEVGHDQMKEWIRRCSQSYLFYKLARQEITINQFKARVLAKATGCEYTCLDDLLQAGLDPAYTVKTAQTAQYIKEYKKQRIVGGRAAIPIEDSINVNASFDKLAEDERLRHMNKQQLRKFISDLEHKIAMKTSMRCRRSKNCIIDEKIKARSTQWAKDNETRATMQKFRTTETGRLVEQVVHRKIEKKSHVTLQAEHTIKQYLGKRAVEEFVAAPPKVRVQRSTSLKRTNTLAGSPDKKDVEPARDLLEAMQNLREERPKIGRKAFLKELAAQACTFAAKDPIIIAKPSSVDAKQQQTKRRRARSISQVTPQAKKDDLLTSTSTIPEQQQDKSKSKPAKKHDCGHIGQGTRMDLLFLRKLKEDGQDVIFNPCLNKRLLYDWEVAEVHAREEQQKVVVGRKRGPRQIHRPERHRLEFERREQDQRARRLGERPTREQNRQRLHNIVEHYDKLYGSKLSEMVAQARQRQSRDSAGDHSASGSLTKKKTMRNSSQGEMTKASVALLQPTLEPISQPQVSQDLQISQQQTLEFVAPLQTDKAKNDDDPAVAREHAHHNRSSDAPTRHRTTVADIFQHANEATSKIDDFRSDLSMHISPAPVFSPYNPAARTPLDLEMAVVEVEEVDEAINSKSSNPLNETAPLLSHHQIQNDSIEIAEQANKVNDDLTPVLLETEQPYLLTSYPATTNPVSRNISKQSEHIRIMNSGKDEKGVADESLPDLEAERLKEELKQRRIKSAQSGVSRQEPLVQSEAEGVTDKDSQQYMTMAANMHSDLSVHERNNRFAHSPMRRHGIYDSINSHKHSFNLQEARRTSSDLKNVDAVVDNNEDTVRPIRVFASDLERELYNNLMIAPIQSVKQPLQVRSIDWDSVMPVKKPVEVEAVRMKPRNVLSSSMTISPARATAASRGASRAGRNLKSTLMDSTVVSSNGPASISVAEKARGSVRLRPKSSTGGGFNATVRDRYKEQRKQRGKRNLPVNQSMNVDTKRVTEFNRLLGKAPKVDMSAELASEIINHNRQSIETISEEELPDLAVLHHVRRMGLAINSSILAKRQKKENERLMTSTSGAKDLVGGTCHTLTASDHLKADAAHLAFVKEQVNKRLALKTPQMIPNDVVDRLIANQVPPQTDFSFQSAQLLVASKSGETHQLMQRTLSHVGTKSGHLDSKVHAPGQSNFYRMPGNQPGTYIMDLCQGLSNSPIESPVSASAMEPMHRPRGMRSGSPANNSLVQRSFAEALQAQQSFEASTMLIRGLMSDAEQPPHRNENILTYLNTNDGYGSQIAHNTIQGDLDGAALQKSILSQQNPMNEANADSSVDMHVKRLQSTGTGAPIELNLTDLNQSELILYNSKDGVMRRSIDDGRPFIPSNDFTPKRDYASGEVTTLTRDPYKQQRGEQNEDDTVEVVDVHARADSQPDQPSESEIPSFVYKLRQKYGRPKMAQNLQIKTFKKFMQPPEASFVAQKQSTDDYKELSQPLIDSPKHIMLHKDKSYNFDDGGPPTASLPQSQPEVLHTDQMKVLLSKRRTVQEQAEYLQTLNTEKGTQMSQRPISLKLSGQNFSFLQNNFKQVGSKREETQIDSPIAPASMARKAIFASIEANNKLRGRMFRDLPLGTKQLLQEDASEKLMQLAFKGPSSPKVCASGVQSSMSPSVPPNYGSLERTAKLFGEPRQMNDRFRQPVLVGLKQAKRGSQGSITQTSDVSMSKNEKLKSRHKQLAIKRNFMKTNLASKKDPAEETPTDSFILQSKSSKGALSVTRQSGAVRNVPIRRPSGPLKIV